MELTFQNIVDFMIRSLGIPSQAFGTISIKLQLGKVKHVTFEESFDLETLKNSKLNIKSTEQMFIKHGAKTTADADSGKILTEVKVNEADEKEPVKQEPKDKKNED